MFTPGNNDASENLFSPETRSKGSIKSRFELEKVLREAYEFLDEPEIQYEAPANINPNIQNSRLDAYRMFKMPKEQLPKVESVEEFVKSKISRCKSLNFNNSQR